MVNAGIISRTMPIAVKIPKVILQAPRVAIPADLKPFTISGLT